MTQQKKPVWWEKSPVWWSLIAAGVLIFVGVSIAAILWAPGYFVSSAIENNPTARGAEAPSVADYVNAVNNARQGVLLIIGGLIAVVTLLISLARNELDRNARDLDRERQQLDQDVNWTTRYTEAIRLLGDESFAIRLGGIYALERIAQDSARDRQNILDVLCSYLIEKSTLKDESQEDDRSMESGTAAAATAVGRITQLSEPSNRVDLHNVNLNGANLSRAYLNRANFSGANFTDADLTDADLTEANLIGAYTLILTAGIPAKVLVTKEYLKKQGAIGIDTVKWLPVAESAEVI